MKKEFSAVLLAGGASSRMGFPKALIPVGGAPLWRRQVEVLESLGPTEMMISAGADWDPGKGAWTVVRDHVPGLGPLGGIAAALGTMSMQLLLVLAVDMPFMSGAFLGSLVEEAGPKGVVPVGDGLFQGLAAVYPKAAGALVIETLTGEDRSLQFFVNRALKDGLLTARPISDAEKALFGNVNRPTDL